MMMLKYLKKAKIIILIQTCLLVLSGIFIINADKNPKKVPVKLSDWYSEYDKFGDGVWNLNQYDLPEEKENKEITFLRGPFIHLEKGSYTIKVKYQTSKDLRTDLYTPSADIYYLEGKEGKLSKDTTETLIHFEAKKDIDNFEFCIHVEGEASVKVSDISIYTNTYGYRRLFVYLLVLFIFGDLYFLTDIKQKYGSQILYFICCAGFLSLPLYIKGMNYGHDLMFHLLRTDGLAKELALGTFPVRMQSLWMGGHGYPVSIFYGDIFLYFPALLRIMGFSVTGAYKIFVFFVNLATVTVSYISFAVFFKDTRIRYLLPVLYSSAAYRLTDVYVRAAVGEYCSMIFLPVIAASVYRICTESERGKEYYKKYPLYLALGMTGVIQSHILSAEMCIFFLLLIYIAEYRRTFRKEVVYAVLLAVTETLLLNMWFIIPFMNYCFAGSAAITANIGKLHAIQSKGAYIGQYFSFFQNIYGQALPNINERLSLTPGLVLMSAFLPACWLTVSGKASGRLKLYTALSAFLLLFSSNVFPWNFMAAYTRIGNILAAVQFPWRYLSISIVMMTLMTGELLIEYFQGSLRICRELLSPKLLCGISCIMMCLFTSKYYNNARIIDYYGTCELSTDRVMGGEYLRPGTNINTRINRIITVGSVKAENTVQSGTSTDVSVKADQGGKLIFPVYNYPGYSIKDETGKEFDISDGINNVIVVDIPKNYEGSLKLRFIEPKSWRIAELISVVSAAAALIILKKDRRTG